MSISKTTLLAIVGLSSVPALAQILACNADVQPDWDFADAMWAGATAGQTEICYPSNQQADCTIFRDDEGGNAVISFCPPFGAGDEGFELSNCRDVSEANTNYEIVRLCADSEPPAGGENNTPRIIFNVFNNPDYTPPASGSIARDVSAPGNKTLYSVTPETITRAELDKLMQKAKSVSAAPAARPRRSMRFDRRQQEGDNEWVTIIEELAVNRPEEERTITGRLPAGSSYMIQESDSQTFSISTTTEISAGFFDIFSASVSLTVGADFTTTTTVGVTVVVDCPTGQEGIIVFNPRYDHYQGNWQPSGDEFEFWIPTQEADSEFASGNYASICLG